MRDLPATLRRRWYLTIAGVLAALGLCLVALQAFPPTYQAKASIVLLPPKTTVEVGGNPYLQLSDLKQAVDVMTRALTSQDALDATKAAAPEGSYEVLPDYATNGPIFIITADDQTPEATLATLKVVTDMVSPTLTTLQTGLGIAPESQITSSVLTTDERPETIRKVQIRVLIVAAGLGAIGSALLIGLIDSFLIRRSQRRRPMAQVEPTVDLVRTVQPLANGGHRAGEMGAGRTRRLGLNNRPVIREDSVVGEADPIRRRRSQ